MKIRRSTLKDRVLVRTRLGESSYGETFAPVCVVWCLLDQTTSRRRDTDGEETTQRFTLSLHPRTQVLSAARTDPLELFTVGSEVVVLTPAVEETFTGPTSRVVDVRRETLRGYVTHVTATCE